MNDKEKLPPASTPDENGQTARSDAQGKVAPKTEERSAADAERQAEAELLKTSGGDPLTQEG